MMKVMKSVTLSPALGGATNAILKALVSVALALLGGGKTSPHLWWGEEVYLLLRQRGEGGTFGRMVARGWSLLWVLRAQGRTCFSCEGQGMVAPAGGLFAGDYLPCPKCQGRGLVAPAFHAFEWRPRLFWATPEGVLHFGRKDELSSAFLAASAPKPEPGPKASPAAGPDVSPLKASLEVTSSVRNDLLPTGELVISIAQTAIEITQSEGGLEQDLVRQELLGVLRRLEAFASEQKGRIK